MCRYTQCCAANPTSGSTSLQELEERTHFHGIFDEAGTSVERD